VLEILSGKQKNALIAAGKSNVLY